MYVYNNNNILHIKKRFTVLDTLTVEQEFVFSLKINFKLLLHQCCTWSLRRSN